MKRMNKVFGIAAAVLIGTFVTQTTAYAQVGQDPKTNARHSRIVGLWDVQVTIASCGNGNTLGSFSGMHKYELGGTGQVVPSTNPANLSAHMAIWSHVGGNDYVLAVKMFRFNAGVNVGTAILNFEVSINEDADELTGSGIAQNFDTAGVFVNGSCPSLVGTRFTGQP